MNDIWLGMAYTWVSIVIHIKFTSSVRFLEVVRNEGYVMLPDFLLQGLRINVITYIEVLDTVVKCWIKETAQWRSYMFQQDFAPSLIWLRIILVMSTHTICLHRSPDLECHQEWGQQWPPQYQGLIEGHHYG